MLVQDFVKENGFDALTEKFGIKVKHYPEDNLVLLDYDQIDSPKSDPIVIECRSLILDSVANVVSRSFDRFFNYGEIPDYYADFNFENSVIFEKADGSLIKVYHNPHTSKWEISTRGMAKAEGEHVMGGTFREKVLEAFGFRSEQEFQEYFEEFGKAFTYIFEYCSPENRIVTYYQEPHMVLLAIRHVDGWYASQEEMAEFIYVTGTVFSYKVRPPKTYKASRFDDLLQAAKELPDLQEGYVVWDFNSGKRVKIKSPTYIIAHKMRGENSLTPKNVMSLILEGEVCEYLSYFPDDKEHFDNAALVVKVIEDEMKEIWERVKDIEEQKDFALQVKDTRVAGVMFEARKRAQCPVKTFHGMDINKKLKLVLNKE